MTLDELGIIIGKKLTYEISRDGGTISVDFNGVRTKQHASALVKSTFGKGVTQHAARDDYAKLINGRSLVFVGSDDIDLEIRLPDTIVAE